MHYIHWMQQVLSWKIQLAFFNVTKDWLVSNIIQNESLTWNRDSNTRFSVIIPPTIWIFMDGAGDKIKSRQGSYNFLTLSMDHCSTSCFILYILWFSARNFTTVATTLWDRKDKQLYSRQRPILSDAELCLLL